jgi:DNA-3-methyladenine glycosylase II
MNQEAINHLSKVDKKLGRLIRKIGPYTLRPKNGQSPHESLVETVVHQQLSGKAASAILGRFKELYPEKRFPTPSNVLDTRPEILRSVGLSRAKVEAIKDIAAKTIEGMVPSSRVIRKMDDAEIMERLTAIHGVGRWTVEMLLIFKLGRADVLPATDFGIRKAFALTFDRKDLPTPKELAIYGEKWKPFRTTAAWYLWRSLGGPILR